MEELTDHLICRACLRIVENKTQSFGFIEDANGNLKDMIMCCVPEMDIYVSSNPIMCFPCIQLLVTVYNFKTRCLNTETIIRSYIQRNNLTEYNHVNLNCVVQELIRLNNYFKEIVPQKPNGISNSDHLTLMERRENLENKFDCEKIRKTEVVKENQYVMEPQILKESQKVLSQDSAFKNLNEPPGCEVGSDLGSEEGKSTLNGDVLEQENTQNNLAGTTGSETIENGCNTSENEAKTISKISEVESNESEWNTVRLEESSKENVGSSPSKHQVLENESSTEKRPRLIIKICKNKITIPPPKNDPPNEENQKMDVEATDRIEMPPPQTDPTEPHQPVTDNGQDLYQCSSCMFVTTHLNYFLSHKKVCGTEQNEKKCPHCPHVTNRQYALNKHINTMHTRSVWYTCDFCPYRSTDSSCLRRHKRNVHPERLGNELMCRLCPYRCTTEYHLKKHMVKHDNNAALQCQFCSYSTRDRSNFRKHIFIHNPKPRHCEFCDYKCVSPYQMKLHLKKFHHGVGMEDVDCRSEVSISEVVQDISAAIKEAKSYVGHQTE